jgi:4-carboxymuconolactone decarboxylase
MNSPARYRELVRGELSQEQQAVFDSIASTRGGVVPTPFHILAESPQLASLTQALGAFCRYRTGLSPRLSELAVLITASHWGAEYEFAVHAPEALKAGVPQAVVEALRDGKTPSFDDEDSRLIHAFVTVFYATRDVPDALFNEAVARFGRRRVVELAGVLGYYSGLAMLLRIFRVEAPPSQQK